MPPAADVYRSADFSFQYVTIANTIILGNAATASTNADVARR